MDWVTILSQALTYLFLIIINIAGTFLIKFLKVKSAESSSNLGTNYVSILATTVDSCLQATNQTYVEALKVQGAFNEEAQKEALNKTKTAVLTILNEEAKTYLTSFYGDLDQAIENLIESKIKTNK